MDTVWWVVIVVAVALVILAIAAWSYSQSRRRAVLRDQFGPEYDRTVGSAGSRRKAERELEERERTHESLELRELSEDARARYTEDWQRAERRFVDDPELAAREADRIVRDVLDERGYPRGDFDEPFHRVRKGSTPPGPAATRGASAQIFTCKVDLVWYHKPFAKCARAGFFAFRSVALAGVAQLVEQLICNQRVGGSSPFTGSLTISQGWSSG